MQRLTTIVVVLAMALTIVGGALTHPVSAAEPEPTRAELQARWDALNEERMRLNEQLRAVGAEMQSVAGEIWEREMDEARDRFNEWLNEYGRHYGEELSVWIPPALIDGVAEQTGREPDEVRNMIRDGAWGDLF